MSERVCLKCEWCGRIAVGVITIKGFNYQVWDKTRPNLYPACEGHLNGSGLEEYVKDGEFRFERKTS